MTIKNLFFLRHLTLNMVESIATAKAVTVTFSQILSCSNNLLLSFIISKSLYKRKLFDFAEVQLTPISADIVGIIIYILKSIYVFCQAPSYCLLCTDRVSTRWELT